MKRRALKLFVFLLAGAIINVAVAWGGVLCSDAQSSSFVHVPAEQYPSSLVQRIPESWRGIALKRHGGPVNMYAHFDFFAVTADDLVVIAGASEWSRSYDRGILRVYHMCAGWPWRSVEGHAISESGATRASERIRLTAAMPIPRGLQRQGQRKALHEVLPVRPLWPGFVINTIFYAAIVWALFAVPGAARRRVRIKRGQCAACGYSLREIISEKCPECGAATPEIKRPHRPSDRANSAASDASA